MSYYRRTFKNGDTEGKGQEYLDMTASAISNWMNYGSNADDVDYSRLDDDEAEEVREFFKDHGDWADYGTAFDFVELGTFDDQTKAYYRFQMSGGGPSDEIRYYHDGLIEYVFLNWGVGVGFDVTNADWAQWTLELFYIDWDQHEEHELVDYDQHYFNDDDY